MPQIARFQLVNKECFKTIISVVRKKMFETNLVMCYVFASKGLVFRQIDSEFYMNGSMHAQPFFHILFANLRSGPGAFVEHLRS